MADDEPIETCERCGWDMPRRDLRAFEVPGMAFMRGEDESVPEAETRWACVDLRACEARKMADPP